MECQPRSQVGVFFFFNEMFKNKQWEKGEKRNKNQQVGNRD